MVDRDIKSYPLRLSGKCPKCEHDFFFPLDAESADESCTCDCNHCGALLMIADRRVYLFHEKMNADNPEWPADGADTHHIEV